MLFDTICILNHVYMHMIYQIKLLLINKCHIKIVFDISTQKSNKRHVHVNVVCDVMQIFSDSNINYFNINYIF